VQSFSREAAEKKVAHNASRGNAIFKSTSQTNIIPVKNRLGRIFDSIHVRTDNSDSVQKALEQVAKEADCKFLFGPAINQLMDG
jgi:hypothetical protein